MRKRSLSLSKMTVSFCPEIAPSSLCPNRKLRPKLLPSGKNGFSPLKKGVWSVRPIRSNSSRLINSWGLVLSAYCLTWHDWTPKNDPFSFSTLPSGWTAVLCRYYYSLCYRRASARRTTVTTVTTQETIIEWNNTLLWKDSLKPRKLPHE